MYRNCYNSHTLLCKMPSKNSLVVIMYVSVLLISSGDAVTYLCSEKNKERVSGMVIVHVWLFIISQGLCVCVCVCDCVCVYPPLRL